MNLFPLLCSFFIYTTLAVSQTSTSSSIKQSYPSISPYNQERNLDNESSSFPKLCFTSSFLPSYAIQLDPDASNDDNTKISMLILISSNETALSDGRCPLFQEYPCSEPFCTEDDSDLFSLNYPGFSSNNASRLAINNSSISLANGTWSLQASPLYIHNCNFSVNSMYYQGALGWIGLGLSSDANNNFRDPNPVFSISINSSTGEGELIFGYNESYAETSESPNIVSSDLDWKMEMTSVAFGDLNSSSDSTALMFDLQYDGIAFPEKNYAELRDYFWNNTDMKICEELVNSFGCVYEGDISTLPSLVLGLKEGQQLLIPPAAYMIKKGTGYYAVFHLSDDTFTETSYTILGWRVMSQFYTVLQHSNGVNIISFYSPLNGLGRQKDLEVSNDDPHSIEESFHINGIVLLLIVLSFGICFAAVIMCKKKQKPRKRSFGSGGEKSRLLFELSENGHEYSGGI